MKPHADDKSTLQAHAKRLVQRIAALQEASMRHAAMQRYFQEELPCQVVWTLETLIIGTLQKSAMHALVYTSLLDPCRIATTLGKERINALLKVAEEESLVAARLWLLAPTLRDEDLADDDAAWLASKVAERTKVSPDALIALNFRDVPLGVRRALARRAQGEALRQLARDPDPIVVTNILNNSRTTEQLVITLCAQRPTLSVALEAVLKVEKWMQRYSVKLALVKNPYLRLATGLVLLPFLQQAHLLEINQDGTLSATLRHAAGLLLNLAPWAELQARRKH